MNFTNRSIYNFLSNQIVYVGNKRELKADDADDDAVERRKLGVNKERTTVALEGFI